MDSGIGETIEVIPRSRVRTEGRWALIPTRVLKCVIRPRGAIHGCRLGLAVLAQFVLAGCWRFLFNQALDSGVPEKVNVQWVTCGNPESETARSSSPVLEPAIRMEYVNRNCLTWVIASDPRGSTLLICVFLRWEFWDLSVLMSCHRWSQTVDGRSNSTQTVNSRSHTCMHSLHKIWSEDREKKVAWGLLYISACKHDLLRVYSQLGQSCRHRHELDVVVKNNKEW